MKANIMRKSVVTAVAVLVLGSLSAAEGFVADFNDTGSVRKRHPSWTVSADGASVRAAAEKGVRGFSLAYSPVCERPFRLSFEARGFALADRGHHFGFHFNTAAGERFFTWAHPERGFIYEITNRAKRKLLNGSGGNRAIDRGGDAPKWSSVVLEADERSFALRLDGDLCYSGAHALLGATNLEFYAYNEGVELRNIRLERLPPRPKLAGAVIGWFRPAAETDSVRLLGDDGKVKATFSIYMYDWARASIRTADPKSREVLFTRTLGELSKRTDEWFHYAFTWDESNRARFYINGIPFATGNSIGERTGHSLLGTRLGEATRLEVKNASVAREVRFLNRTLSGREIVEEYRRTMPVDLVINDSVVEAGKTGHVCFRLAPGGRYQRPNPVEALSNVCAEVTVSSRIRRVTEKFADKRDPKKATGYAFKPVAGGETAPVRVSVDRVRDIPAADLALEPGLYRLDVIFHRPEGDHLRCLFFTAMDRIDVSAKPETKDDLRLGALLCGKTFRAPSDAEHHAGTSAARTSAAGTYLQAGAKCGDRFATVLTIPESEVGRPCILEVDWPDDAERAMSFYMYEVVPASVRDHLEEGIVAGGVVPNTGRMQTARYIYWPTSPDALFEARTMIARRPAAVAAVRMYAIDGELPRLRVHRPEGLPSRTFGHCDEDQSFDTNLTSVRLKASVPEVLTKLVDYFAYTGQSAFHYSTMRYHQLYFGPAEGTLGQGTFPRRQGSLLEIARSLRRNGIEFVPQAIFATDPTISRLALIEGTDVAAGREMLDRDGLPVKRFGAGEHMANIANPGEQDRFLSLFTDVLQDLSTNGVDRILVCMENPIGSPFCWPDPDCGYDAWTVNRFRAETGAEKPEGEVWNRWRAKVVTDYFCKFCARVREVRPDLAIIVEVSADPDRYEKRGVDLEAIAKIPNVQFAVIRHNTRYWFKLFQGANETDDLERLYDLASPELARLRKLCGGSVPVVYSYPTYFETFTNPPGGDKRFGCHFQDSDMKPWGRNFLREPAFAVAAGDALHYAIGMQPLGSWGSEAAVREFTQAYSALPALPFKDIPGPGDPVTARCLQTKNGTYVYLVNIHHTPACAALSGEGAIDLSTDKAVDLSRIELKPYQLRSFLVPKRSVSFTGTKVVLTEEQRRCYDARRGEIERAFRTLADAKVDCSAAQETFDAAKRAEREGRLGEAHRLYYSRAMNALLGKLSQIENVVAEAKMNREGRWAVNCGCSAYTVSDGRLFSPDQPWDGAYGFYGRHRLTAPRDTALVADGTPFKELFESESYDFDGYRFKLPPGRYRVKLILKWAYPRAFTPNFLKLDYLVNGRSVKGGPLDLHAEQGGDIKKALFLSSDATVGEDGLLDISVKSLGKDQTLRLLNGIEIERTDDAARHGSSEMNQTEVQADWRSEGGVRILFLGNSITLHGPAPKIGWTNDWGMAASAPEKDYVHLVTRGIEERTGRKADVRVRNLYRFERDFRNYDLGAGLADLKGFEPDYLVVSLGENAPDLSTEDDRLAFRDAFVRLLSAFFHDGLRPKTVIRGLFWPNDAKNAALMQVADAVAVPIVTAAIGEDRAMLAYGRFAHEGVCRHPGDAGMAELARRLLAGFFPIDAIYERCEMNALSVGLDIGGKTVFSFVRAAESVSSNEVAWAADGVTHYVKTRKAKKPFDAETPLETASVTKTVTAMLVLQLVTEGRLALEDPVVKFIPEYPDPEVTVLNMLTHTSGWRAKGGIDQKDKSAFYKAMTREFPCGTEFRYFSSGYDVLIDLVERVTGEKRGADLAKRRIFEPLGMTHSSMKHHVGQVGLTTTVSDMLLLGREILDVYRTGRRGKAFDPGTVKLMMTPVLKKGFWRTPVFFINNMRYTGFCQSFGRRNSSEAVGHGGSSGCYFLLDPKLDAVGIILSRSPKAAIHTKNLYGPIFDEMLGSAM